MCWLGLNVNIHISTLFLLCPFAFILPLEVWETIFCNKRLLSAVCSELFFFFLQGVGYPVDPG